LFLFLSGGKSSIFNYHKENTQFVFFVLNCSLFIISYLFKVDKHKIFCLDNVIMQKVLILDFGSQFTQLIARRIRELGVYSEIQPFTFSVEKIKQDKDIKAIILSGGPSSIYEENSPNVDIELFNLGLSVLGICYGLQLLVSKFGGEVGGSHKREYGRAELEILNSVKLFKNLEKTHSTVWMSHGDKVTKLPPDFQVLARTESCEIAAAGNFEKKIFGLQFHPEVMHSVDGKTMISNFLFEICDFAGDWNAHSFVEQSVLDIANKVGENKVLCGLSGGVDSSVAAVLIHKAIGEKLHCIFVDHGLLRFNERTEVETIFRENFHINLTVVDASEIFLSRLENVVDPEQKRKIVGSSFIEVFQASVKMIEQNEDLEFIKLENKDLDGDYIPKKFRFLAQGTLYPDVIESISFNGGPSHTIKSHHNVGGLPEKMHFSLIEPFREMFKDEVREVGLELGLPDSIVHRHPFPGPSLAIRIISNITKERLFLLQKADDIFISELKKQNLYHEVWQAGAILTPIQTVGVMGDGRTYDFVLALRAVTSTDGMTADWARLPYDFLAMVSNRIINEVKGINRVVYDISSKPPATIEWE
jgi:GMP synthase (glutamine-hydrolysing)